MMSKKALYQPAPERISPLTAPSLQQGDSTNPDSRNIPKIKQGVLETTHRGSRPLTSTLKSATVKPSSRKPIIVCHDPNSVHAKLQSSDSNAETKVAADTVEIPKSIVVQPKLNTSVDKNKRQRTVSAKKKRLVDSRYKQAATNASNMSFKTLAIKKPVKSSGDLSESSSLKTPSARLLKPGKTSTPASAQGSSFDWNASAIEKAQGSFNPMEETVENVQLENTGTAWNDIENLYCHYMQWHLLNQTVEQTRRRKAKQYIEQLNVMHSKNSDQSKEIEELRKEVLLLEHQCTLESQLRSQRTALAPVADKLQSAIRSYNLLSENLDTTRHNLPLGGIQVPDMLTLEATLDETRNLLGQVNILTRSQAPVVASMAENVGSLHKSCIQEAETLHPAREELKKGVATVLQSASLACQLSMQES